MTLKPEDLREKVARIIDPRLADRAWVFGPGYERLSLSSLETVGDRALSVALTKADAILALLSPADGWRLVPVDPDGAMKMAGCAAPRSEATKAATNTLERQMETVADIYRAMIAAAPRPPGGGDE